MDGTRDLQEEVRRLTQTVAEMRDRMARLEGVSSTDAESSHSDRRGFLRLGAGAVLGALGWAAVKAVPASAATGGPMVLGNPNLAENPTTLTLDGGTSVQVLGVKAAGTPTIGGTFVGPLQGLGADGGEIPLTAVDADGVDGWAKGVRAAGVYGLTNSGYGVIGESSSGIGLYARSTGRIQQDAQPGTFKPAYIPNNFEQVRGLDGVLWIHNAAGEWRRVNSPRADAADGLGGAFKPLRIVDTRSASGPAGATGGGALNGTTRNYQVAGDVGSSPASQIPTDAIAVFGNLTAIGGAQGGFMAIHPAGVAYNPATDPATFNFTAGGVVSNGFFCGLGTGGSLGKIAVYIGVFGTSKANFIIDITGYVQ
jgi:hypothetical protein